MLLFTTGITKTEIDKFYVVFFESFSVLFLQTFILSPEISVIWNQCFYMPNMSKDTTFFDRLANKKNEDKRLTLFWCG